MHISGYFLDGKTSRQIAARLEVLSESSQILVFYSAADESRLAEVKLADIHISSRVGNASRELSLAGGEQFVTEQNDLVDALLKQLKVSGLGISLAHRLESSLMMILASVVISSLVAWSAAVYGVPGLARYIAFNMPALSTEQYKTDLLILDKTTFEPSTLSVEKQQDVRELLDPYIHKYIEDSDAELIPVLNFRSGVGVNAFALPSGQIVFTDELIELVKEDQELIAILFHELGHLKEKHMLRRSLQGSIMTLLLLFIIGDITTFDFVSGVPALIADLSYSRDFEREADIYALHQLDKQHVGVEFFSMVMTRMADINQQPDNYADESESSIDFNIDMGDFLQTHPGWEERIEMVERFNQGDY
jgi:Zn-dependent protease with chaperone function